MIFFLVSAPTLLGQECPPLRYDHDSNDFYYVASSAEGAVGDVVPVEVGLVVDALHGDLFDFSMVVTYNHDLATFLGEPVYSEYFDEIASFANLYELPGPKQKSSTGKLGFILGGLIRANAGEQLLAGRGLVPLGTFHFRLKGNPGDSFQFTFNDREFFNQYISRDGSQRCSWVQSELSYNLLWPTEEGDAYYHARSDRHVPGTIQIIGGEATRLEPPTQEPEAKVYSIVPSASAGVLFELSGALVTPGATEVPITLSVVSDYEFIGYSFAGRFPAQYLELSRIEHYLRPGLHGIENGSGEFWGAMSNARRRMAPEGERIKVATLFFDVKEAASAVDRLDITLESLRFSTYTNWLNIRGSSEGNEPIEVKVEPLTVVDSMVRIRNSGEALRGDVNSDGAFDVSDPIQLVTHLFQGGPLECPRAGDLNDDATLDIADAIGMLSTLFLGTAGNGSAAQETVVCR